MSTTDKVSNLLELCREEVNRQVGKISSVSCHDGNEQGDVMVTDREVFIRARGQEGSC